MTGYCPSVDLCPVVNGNFVGSPLLGSVTSKEHSIHFILNVQHPSDSEPVIG